MKRRFWHTILALTAAGALVLSGCGSQSTEGAQTQDTTDSLTEASAEESETVTTSEGIVINTAFAQSSGETMVDLDVTSMFTDRALSGSYDENESEHIVLGEDSVTITEEGTYILSGTLKDGMVIVDVQDTEKVQLVLDGVEIVNSTGAAIYVKQADKVFITLAEGSTNTLKSTGEFVAIDENTIDATIFSKDDLTINGTGSLIVESAKGHGIVSKDDLVITNGTMEVTAASKGIAGNDSVRIADGNITITSGTDAIHAGNGEDTDKGFVYIENGSIYISAGDDGIHADNILLIAGGTIEIAESYEGLEGLAIEIRDGVTRIVAKDDGINAAGGNDQSGGSWADMFASQEGVLIHIAGGYLSVNADGDGIDSNGDLYVSGGNIYVSGPTNSANGALDHNGTAQITGGIVVAVGASGMAENFGDTSTQGSILVNTSSAQAAGTEVKLLDSDGNVLASYTSEKSFNSVVVSCPDLEVGSTYTLQIGSENTEITLESLIYGSGQGMGGFGGGGMRGGQGAGGQEQGGQPGFGGRGEQGELSGERPEFNGEMPEGEIPQGGSGFGGGERPEGKNEVTTQ